jgi:hypothetical protein
VFYREKSDGTYSTSAFLTSYMVMYDFQNTRELACQIRIKRAVRKSRKIESGDRFIYCHCSEVPFELATVLLFTALVMPAIGLQSSPDRLFSNFIVFWCLVFSGESISIIFCGLFYTVGFALIVTSGRKREGGEGEGR